jgi:hypothetical protein
LQVGDRYIESFRGFRILSRTGEILVDLDNHLPEHPQEGCLAARIDLAPGFYRLALWRGKEGGLEMPLQLVAGWTTSLFLTMLPESREDAVREPDLCGASLYFDREMMEFDPNRRDLRVMETLRQALRKGNPLYNRAAMDHLLEGKIENPMLGLFAAHLLLLEKDREWSQIETVVRNTGNLLGSDFPDILVLRYLVGKHKGGSIPQASMPLKSPPLFRISWKIIEESQGGIPCDFPPKLQSLLELGNLVRAGIWMAWENDPEISLCQSAVLAHGCNAEFDNPTAGTASSKNPDPSHFTSALTLNKDISDAVDGGALATLQTVINELGKDFKTEFRKESEKLDFRSWFEALERFMGREESWEDDPEFALLIRRTAQTFPWNSLVRLLMQAESQLGINPARFFNTYQRSLITVFRRLKVDLAESDVGSVTCEMNVLRGAPRRKLMGSVKIIGCIANFVARRIR